MDIHLGNPTNWLLLLIAASVWLLALYAAFARRSAVRKFATPNLTRHLLPKDVARGHLWSTLLIVATLGLLAVALVDIRWGKSEQEVPQRGIEVMFVLDVSRSMLAEDASPTRLDRAKQQIKDMVDEMTGDRIGLVVFAGDSRQSVPLTSHYEDFKQTLDSVGPFSVRRGGSQLGDAIRSASASFIDKTHDHKAMVIFTDGEDQESEPVQAARQAFEEKGIRIFTVGLGDMDQGARIPETDPTGRGSYLKYNGQPVWSKLNGEILSQIAKETNGAFIPAGTKRVDMAGIYRGYIADVEETDFETAKINAYIPRYQWFALPALVLLLGESLLATGRRKLSPMAFGQAIDTVELNSTGKAA